MGHRVVAALLGVVVGASSIGAALAQEGPTPHVQELALFEAPWTQKQLELQVQGGTGWERRGDQDSFHTPVDLEMGIVDRWQLALGGGLQGEHDDGWRAGAGPLRFGTLVAVTGDPQSADVLSAHFAVETAPLDDDLSPRTWRIAPSVRGSRRVASLDLVGGVGAVLDEPSDDAEERRMAALLDAGVVGALGELRPSLEVHAELSGSSSVLGAGGLSWVPSDKAQLGAFGVVGAEEGELVVGARLTGLGSFELAP